MEKLRNLAQPIMGKLGGWVNELAAPMPVKVIEEPEGLRAQFGQFIPQSLMVGKCVRAVSGIRAALTLADLGYVTECAALLRMVSDFCTEIRAVGAALHLGDEAPSEVRTFVEQYFVERARSADELAAQERIRYVSREALVKAQGRLAEDSFASDKARVWGQEVQKARRFLNMTFDAYVHGASETALELYNPATRRFMVGGDTTTGQRREHADMVYLKLHEVVTALEITASCTAHEAVYSATREARRSLDAAGASAKSAFAQ